MIRNLLLLCVFVLPFLGLSQSARKINKALKSDYAVQLQVYDSLMRVNDSVISRFVLLADIYEKLQRERGEQALWKKKQNVINTYKSLIQLEVNESIPFTLQFLDSILIPSEISKLKLINVSKSIPRLEWDLSLDKLTIKEQNLQITNSLNELTGMNLYLALVNREIDQLVPKLLAKQEELEELGRGMTSTDELLTEKINFLIAQKELARTNFSVKGPQGFNEYYFVVFPEVFPEMNQDLVVDEGTVRDRGDWDDSVINQGDIIAERKEQVVFVYVDESASFNGDLKLYLAANINYPKRALELGLQGKCYLQFIVGASGKISNIAIKRGVPDCPECDEEAVRVVKGMPKWNPGKKEGVAVDSTFNLPIHFKLSTE